MKLYIANLGYEVTQEDVINQFKQWRPRDVYVGVNDRGPRGFAFITVADEVAEHVISEMNGTFYAGRRMVVQLARNQKEDKKWTRRKNANAKIC